MLSPQAIMAMGFRQANQPNPRPMPQESDPLVDLYIMNPALFREHYPYERVEAPNEGVTRSRQLQGTDILSPQEIEAAQRLWAEQNPPSTTQQFLQWLESVSPKLP